MSPEYGTNSAILERLKVRQGLLLRQVAVLTGTVKNLGTWESKKGLIFGKLDLACIIHERIEKKPESLMQSGIWEFDSNNSL